jgi:uncharacterized protein (DUF1499 family)
MQTLIKRMIIMGIWASLLSACAGERPQTLGARDGQLSPCPSSPNCVTSQGGNDQHSIAPLIFTGDPALAWQELRELLATRRDTTIVVEEPNYLRVEFRTTFFVDDGEFLLNEEGRRIEMRSASRVGYSDLGKNRARLEELRRALEKARSPGGK